MAANRHGSEATGGAVGAQVGPARFRTSRSETPQARQSVARPRNLTTFRQLSGTCAVSSDPLGGGLHKYEPGSVSEFRIQFKSARRVGRTIR